MYFKRMELNGFKSFADPVTIEFTDGITCIVGPNGSGKSNISDAIRWVLGEQSPKSLRGGKMEDVIFAGTQNRKAKGMAEVTLVIDNTERTLPIDFAEVGITRRMYRSGESEYMINRTPCRLRDIRELIMDTGIGVEGYSIIGQGKIADIVSNRMESRREIFEEAAGIVKYRTRKADTEKSLAAAKANLERVNDIVFELEGRIGSLEEESKKAAEYLDLKEKYKKVEINVLLKNIEQSDSRSEAEKTRLSELEEAILAREASKDELDLSVKSFRAESESLEERLNELRDGLIAKNDEINQIINRKELNRERLASLEKDSIRLEDEMKGIDEKLERLSASLEEFSAREKEAEKERNRAKEALALREKEASEAEDSLNVQRAKADELKNLILQISSQMAEFRVETQSLESLKQTLEARVEKIRQEGSTREEALGGLRDSLMKEEEALKALNDNEAQVKQALYDQIMKIEDLSSRSAALTGLAEELKVSSGKLSAREKLLVELENSYEGYGGGVRFLMGQKLSGIIGVLGELLVVPRGWELAIETVLGAKMQDIVCKDDETAKRAIDLLKKNQAGRLTFLPVETLRVPRPSDTSAIQGCKGFLGLASERVSCRTGHQNIIDYMLGKVVVCTSLDDALHMSRLNDAGLRFVTLEGEIINGAGAITGGSMKNNTANILTRKAETQKLRARLNEESAKLTETLAALKQTAGDKQQAEEKKASITAILSGCQTERIIKEKELEQLRANLKGFENEGEASTRELMELDKEIRNAENNRELSQNKLMLAEKRSGEAKSDLEKALELVPGLEGAAQTAREALTQAKLSESSAALRLTNALDRLDALKETERELQDDKEARRESLEKNRILRQQTGAFSDGAEGALAEKEAEKTELEKQIASLDEKRKELLIRSEKADEELRAAGSALYELQLEKHEADLRLSRFEAQTDGYKEKIFEEFSLSYAQAYDLADPDFALAKGVRESREYKERMRELGDVNVKSIAEYADVKERYDFLSAQRADILKAIDDLNTVISDTDALIKARFKESFDSVVGNFEICFRELFKGGSARLSLEDPERPMESAIEIEAQPPGKKLQNINLLSGGEKTMTAIALMFAVLKSKPTPFCILDEVEAALDENNIQCFASYLKNFTDTQFALVTHQKATMEHADVLYGVTMPEHGISRVLSLRLGDEIKL